VTLRLRGGALAQHVGDMGLSGKHLAGWVQQRSSEHMLGLMQAWQLHPVHLQPGCETWCLDFSILQVLICKLVIVLALTLPELY
jgi:hypothetical protein